MSCRRRPSSIASRATTSAPPSLAMTRPRTALGTGSETGSDLGQHSSYQRSPAPTTHIVLGDVLDDAVLRMAGISCSDGRAEDRAGTSRRIQERQVRVHRPGRETRLELMRTSFAADYGSCAGQEMMEGASADEEKDPPSLLHGSEYREGDTRNQTGILASVSSSV
ncbi:hypothetical protein MKEN_00390600 [Mycena kentingensis (nom. inval.)]|nr:hypothetical protein MKEN_00390600 [Mycena kentingensis (nom. inval.)]